MSTLSTAKEDRARASKRSVSVQTYARMAGVLMLVSMLAGIFGEMYVPSKLIVSSDATATAGNIASFHMLFRLGFASYLVEALCDVGLTLIFYVLLKPVQKNIALLAVLFGIISTALYGVAELFYIAAPLVLANHDYLKVFSPDQLNALALLSLQLYAYGAEIFMVFYGTAAVLRGYLIFRSGYLPRTLGVLWVLAGFGFIAKNFLLVLGPSYASDLLLLPMLIAGLSLMTWLLVKGVDVARWEERKELTLGFEKAT